MNLTAIAVFHFQHDCGSVCVVAFHAKFDRITTDGLIRLSIAIRVVAMEKLAESLGIGAILVPNEHSSI